MEPQQIEELCSKVQSLRFKRGVDRPRKFKKIIRCFERRVPKEREGSNLKKPVSSKNVLSSPEIKVPNVKCNTDQSRQEVKNRMAVEILQTANFMGIPLLKDEETSLKMILSRLGLP